MATSSSLAWSTAALLRMAGVAGAAFAGGAFVGGKRGRAADAASTTTPDKPAAAADNNLILKHGAPAPMGPTGPLCYENHCLQYDPQRKVPLWVAERLTRDMAHPDAPGADRRRSKFRPDSRLDPLGRSDNSDFHASGWSRGHMAPAGNNKHSQKAMDDTFLLSNVVPQDFDNNGDFWNRLEIYCRDLTKKFSSVHVISGPLWMAREPKEKDRQRAEEKLKETGYKMKPPKKISHYVIGDNEVSVPTHLYKVVVAERDEQASGDGERKELPPLVAAFVVPNKPISRTSVLKDFEVPISLVERRVGYRFLQKLDRDKAENLCEVEGCQMMDYRKFQSYYLQRGMRGARNLRELERYVRKAKDQELWNPSLSDLYEDRKSWIERREEERADKEGAAARERAAAVAGA